ncbi:HNH endonuclease domain-containing protein [Sphingobacterium sp. B16(2022)]|uniref:HNH endonuclease domain-containing protein n=1 Tax=Sphingobacterium sp. B16(2022) TaxID=2914044 RepID=UPI0019D270C3|nr:HNH endonuclease domain-containing protein [Sphingobacterium sp. B16(2022)]
MLTKFQINDPSLESQWRALILFGKNSATYKFAFAKAIIELLEQNNTTLTLEDLASPFARNIIEHLKKSDKQGNSSSSKFLNTCRDFIEGKLSEDQLIQTTTKLGFVNVVDAFQNVNGGIITDPFYHKNYLEGKKEIMLTDNIFKLKEAVQFINLDQEVDARWNLVETAWNLQINPNLLEVKHDALKQELYIESDFMRRISMTTVRDALSGYQKGKCFYSYQDIFVNAGSPQICAVDHFLPHLNKKAHSVEEANINGVWNLVLADPKINTAKSAKVPHRRFLERLYNRNEFYIESKHPLAETIVNQTGKTKERRRLFLQQQYNVALSHSIHEWTPSIEIPGTF